jgi:cobalt-zinc-cadmium efflux system membrane fusion protein
MFPNVRGMLKYILTGILLASLIVGGVVGTQRLMRYLAPQTAEASGEGAAAQAARLVGEGETISLSPELAANLGVQTCKVEPSSSLVTLELSGTLVFDQDRLSHVHARFPGEIVELGAGDGQSPTVGFGQHVRKGQMLAVIWSHDLGEKKSELIDALSQLRVDEDSLARIKAATDGAIPDRLIRDAERKVEADRIAGSKAVRTLQSWRISEQEIGEVRAEAARLLREKAQDREQLVRQWAKLEVLAPLDGVIIERNVALGDLVDTNLDLFKVADLSRLRVVAHAYEEDLPALDALTSDRRGWSVSVAGGGEAATRAGWFDRIGCIIDPNQHTALVMGWVDNADGRLRVGQFATVRLGVPPPTPELVIPAAALCEEGGRTTVFLHPEGSEQYTRREVVVSRRSGDHVYLRSRLTAEERSRGLEPLSPGQLVVTSRLAQLTANLNEVRSAGKPAADKPGA